MSGRLLHPRPGQSGERRRAARARPRVASRDDVPRRRAVALSQRRRARRGSAAAAPGARTAAANGGGSCAAQRRSPHQRRRLRTQASASSGVPSPRRLLRQRAAATSAQSAEFNPLAWEVPVICKDCNEPWTIPYRLFEQGVVFHCPSCSGSFVPKTAMYRAVKETFEGFYNRRRAEREAFERKRGARGGGVRSEAGGRDGRVQAEARGAGAFDETSGQDGEADGHRRDVHVGSRTVTQPLAVMPQVRAFSSRARGP